MTEEKLIQFAYNWAVHMWYEADQEYNKHKHVAVLKEEEQKAWKNVKDIEKIAKEKGYTL